jgi:opacity protein-like surface antigen
MKGGNMSKHVRNAVLTLGLGLWLSGVAFAQLKDNIEINLFGGGSWYSAKNFEISYPQSVTPILGRFHFDNAWKGGVRLGVYTRGHWGEEFFYSYEPNNAHFIRRTPPTGAFDLSVQVHSYGATALYYLNDDESQRWRPFLSVGLGGTVYMLTADARTFATDPLRGNLLDIDNSNELVFNYGAGVKTRGSRWLGFRADVRGFVGRTPSFGLARRSTDPNATVFPVSGGLYNAEASAGVILYFFGKR